MIQETQMMDESHHRAWLERQLELQAQCRATACFRPLDSDLIEEAKGLDRGTYFEIDQALFHQGDVWHIEAFKTLYRKHRFTPYQVAQYILQRISVYNEGLHAITQLAPEVFREAEALWAEADASLDVLYRRMPLWGIPVVVKDNIATGTDMPNTAGAYALLHATTTRPSTVVERLKAAGALVVGKANLSEWANFMTLDSSNGYSALGGQTVNPFGPFDVGGSSSGSCVAVAAKLVPIAVGTETAGSLIYPASQNRVVAIKPTVGLVSRDLIIPISDTQDTAGPIANTVADAALLLEVISGPCPHDPKTQLIPEGPRKYLEACQPGPTSNTRSHNIRVGETRQPITRVGETRLHNIRVGLVQNPAVLQDYREGDLALVDAAVRRLELLGYEVTPVMVDPMGFETHMFDVLLYEFYRDVNRYLEHSDVNTVLNIEDIVKYNEKDLENRAAFGQSLLERCVSGRPTQTSYQEAVKRSVFRTSRAIYQALQSVDVLMTVSNYATALYATAGYPAINVPMGFRENGEPVGLTFFGGAFQEEQLLVVASAFES